SRQHFSHSHEGLLNKHRNKGDEQPVHCYQTFRRWGGIPAPLTALARPWWVVEYDSIIRGYSGG
ncbi:MAG: hypothetical protein VW520_08440, partial [Candidatus Puniceispirillum sp.]